MKGSKPFFLSFLIQTKMLSQAATTYFFDRQTKNYSMIWTHSCASSLIWVYQTRDDVYQGMKRMWREVNETWRPGGRGSRCRPLLCSQTSCRSFWMSHSVLALACSCVTSSSARAMLTTLTTPPLFSTHGRLRYTSSPMPYMPCCRGDTTSISDEWKQAFIHDVKTASVPADQKGNKERACATEPGI